MAATFDQYVAEEARVFSISQQRLQDDLHYLRRLDRLYDRLDAATKLVDEDQKHIRHLQDLAHVRLFTASLTYMRGQRADSFGLARGGIEAAINAFLLHRGTLSTSTFETGGRQILGLYRTVSNPDHANYVPELKEFLETRSSLSKWGSHSEFSAYVFRLGEEGEQTYFNFFDAEEDNNAFRFYFVAVVNMFNDAARVFCAAHQERGASWVRPIIEDLNRLSAEAEAHVRTLGFLGG